jgi:hypothetical protein
LRIGNVPGDGSGSCPGRGAGDAVGGGRSVTGGGGGAGLTAGGSTATVGAGGVAGLPAGGSTATAGTGNFKSGGSTRASGWADDPPGFRNSIDFGSPGLSSGDFGLSTAGIGSGVTTNFGSPGCGITGSLGGVAAAPTEGPATGMMGLMSNAGDFGGSVFGAGGVTVVGVISTLGSGRSVGPATGETGADMPVGGGTVSATSPNLIGFVGSGVPTRAAGAGVAA